MTGLERAAESINLNTQIQGNRSAMQQSLDQLWR
jgi:hypothetical protein